MFLVEPARPSRPDVVLWYKIEEGKEYFIMDRGGYAAIRDYVIALEIYLDAAISEIRETNTLQEVDR